MKFKIVMSAGLLLLLSVYAWASGYTPSSPSSNSVNSSAIQNGAVTTPKLADGILPLALPALTGSTNSTSATIISNYTLPAFNTCAVFRAYIYVENHAGDQASIYLNGLAVIATGSASELVLRMCKNSATLDIVYSLSTVSGSSTYYMTAPDLGNSNNLIINGVVYSGNYIVNASDAYINYN